MYSSCGLKGKEPGYLFESADFDHFQVIYVLQGQLKIAVQNNDIPLLPGWIAILPIGSSFRLHCDGMGYQGAFASLFEMQGADYHGAACGVHSSPELRTIAGLLAAEVANPSAHTQETVEALGISMAEYSIRLRPGFHQEVAPGPDTWVRQACQSIERTIYTHLPLAQRLSSIPLSYRQLSRHFKKIVGMTPKQYEMQCRLLEAKRLLTSTRLSITSIALELGFASSQHFSNQFARQIGLPPSAYRPHTKTNC
ncbi:MAG: helix-turn-helix domain-containing protein [Armatimonadota bacterium]